MRSGLIQRRLRGPYSEVLFFVRRDLVDRYRADFLGAVWVFLQPLVFIALFASLFSGLMRSRLPGVESGHGYTVYLISGLLAWNAFAQSLSRISTWYRDHAYLYRKVPIGLILPPVSVLISESVVYLASMIFLALFMVGVGYPISSTWWSVVLVMLLLFGFAYCIGLFFAFFEVFVPDLRRVIPIVLQIGFWLTPIVYVPSVVPGHLQMLLQLNPLAVALGAIHQSVVFGSVPTATTFFTLVFIVAVSAGITTWFYGRVHKALRDAL